MDQDHEARALAEVQERLEARFPDLEPHVVADAVAACSEQITGPVRDFVPLLVEKAARARLEDRRGAGGRGVPIDSE